MWHDIIFHNVAESKKKKIEYKIGKRSSLNYGFSFSWKVKRLQKVSYKQQLAKVTFDSSSIGLNVLQKDESGLPDNIGMTKN